MRIVSWNVAHRPELWPAVWDLEADIALLQEATEPSVHRDRVIPRQTGEWSTLGMARRSWRTAVVRLSDEVSLREHALFGVHEESLSGLLASRPGTLTVADLMVDGEPVLRLASMYGVWERAPGGEDRYMWADAAVHRLFSDLSQLVTGRSSDVPVVAAGDLNILFGYGEQGNAYWARRYQTVFDRAEALGLALVGPQAPFGRQADPWPRELPRGSLNVPTFHTSGQTPATATRQLDYVFASSRIADHVQVRALNEPDQWGPSDHCQVVIEILD